MRVLRLRAVLLRQVAEGPTFPAMVAPSLLAPDDPQCDVGPGEARHLELVTVGSRTQGAMAVEKGVSSPVTCLDRTAQPPPVAVLS